MAAPRLGPGEWQVQARSRSLPGSHQLLSEALTPLSPGSWGVAGAARPLPAGMQFTLAVREEAGEGSWPRPPGPWVDLGDQDTFLLFILLKLLIGKAVEG